MSTLWETFISDFHAIQGVTIKERQQNLRNLLKDSDLFAEDQQLIADNLKPKTYLESLWYIDVLIYFKRTQHLLQFLKYGKAEPVGKILKQQWFLKEVFAGVSAEELVDDFFPLMSFSVKMKLLKKLTAISTEAKMDQVFDSVSKRYGIFMATTVLHACSLLKITNILEDYDVTLKINQLKLLFHRERNLLYLYFDKTKLFSDDESVYEKFLIYVAQKDPVFFWEFLEKFDFCIEVKLGRRTTKKAIVTKRQNVITEPEKYINYLRKERLVRVLNKQDDFKQLYRNLFPRNIQKFDTANASCNELLKYYPKHRRYDLFVETFDKVIKQDIWSRPNNLDDSLLKLIFDKDVREKWAKLKYTESNNFDYLQYYNINTCISLIKEKIELTGDMGSRAKLLSVLVKACALNNDLLTFEEILKYFCERHRNEDDSTRADFLDAIADNIELEALTETHWKYINEILVLQGLNKVYRNRNKKLETKYVEYLLLNNGPEDEINACVKNYVTGCITDTQCRIYDIKDAETEKKLLLKIMEHLPLTASKDSNSFWVWEEFYRRVISYGERNPKNKINMFENEKFITFLKLAVNWNKMGFQNLDAIVWEQICKVNRSEFDNMVCSLYWEHLNRGIPYSKVPLWFLTHDPLVFIENLDKAIEVSIERLDYSRRYAMTLRVWTKTNLYSHLNLDEKIQKYLLKKVSIEKIEEAISEAEEYQDIIADKYFKTPAIVILSSVCSAQYYIDVIRNRNLIPTSPKVDITDAEARSIYKEQIVFAKCFRHVNDPSQYISFLVNTFCEGDYLKYALAPLHKAFYRCPEHELKLYLDKLSNHNTMSRKKVSIVLSYYVFDYQVPLETLQKFAGDKNTSLQKFMFSSCLKYLIHNPIEVVYEKLIQFMNLLKGNDVESLRELYTMKIPKKEKCHYIQHSWTLIEALRRKEKETDQYQLSRSLGGLLLLMDATYVQKVPQDFCKKIIQNYFLKDDKWGHVIKVSQFVVKFLMYRDEQSENFDFVFKLLSENKQTWDSVSSKIKAWRIVYDFFGDMYKNACQTDVSPNFIELFHSHWNETFNPIEAFDEYVRINYLLLKKDSHGDSKELAQKIALFFEQVIELFGEIVFSKFCASLAKSLEPKCEERSDLLLNILLLNSTPLNCLLVIELITISGDLFFKDEINGAYRDMISILGNIMDPQVQLFYNYALKGEEQ